MFLQMIPTRLRRSLKNVHGRSTGCPCTLTDDTTIYLNHVLLFVTNSHERVWSVNHAPKYDLSSMGILPRPLSNDQFSVFVRHYKDVFHSSVNYFFWNENLNSASRCLPCLFARPSRSLVPESVFWDDGFFFPSRPILVESSMSTTSSLQNSCLSECVFVGLGDRVQHSSFCDFCILVIWSTGGNDPLGIGSSRWSGSPVPALDGEVVHRYVPLTDQYRFIGRVHRPVAFLTFISPTLI
jgi:hypothetical protein